jgi:hypothetical protein
MMVTQFRLAGRTRAELTLNSFVLPTIVVTTD